MRLALLAALFLVGVSGAQEKKPEKITPENIEVGKVGTFEKFTIEKILNADNDELIASSGTLRVLVIGYPTKGLGNGRVLPADFVWRVSGVSKVNDRDFPSGTFIVVPAKKK